MIVNIYTHKQTFIEILKTIEPSAQTKRPSIYARTFRDQISHGHLHTFSSDTSSSVFFFSIAACADHSLRCPANAHSHFSSIPPAFVSLEVDTIPLFTTNFHSLPHTLQERLLVFSSLPLPNGEFSLRSSLRRYFHSLTSIWLPPSINLSST